MNIDRTMNDNELKRMEQESAELLGLLREVRDEDNTIITPRHCKPYAQKVRRTISPYWLVAASVLGFVLGMAIPRGTNEMSEPTYALLADSSYTVGRSLASGDVNFSLLVVK